MLKQKKNKKLCFLILLSAFLSSCGIHVRGVQSHISNKFAKEDNIIITRIRAQPRSIIRSPKIDLFISLGNSYKTSETLLFVFIPLNVERFEKHEIDYSIDEKYSIWNISIIIKPKVHGSTLNINKLKVTIDRKEYYPAMAELNGFEVDLTTNQEIKLDNIGEEYSFILQYKALTPPPEKSISIDFSNSLLNNNEAILPIIYFKRKVFSYTYS